MIDLSGFLETGIHHFPHRADPEKARQLLAKARQVHAFGPEIFLDEAEFRRNPQFKGVNPMPGRNLAEKLVELTSFVDNDPQVIANLEAILGSGYRIKDKKFVCGVPQTWIPAWVKDYIRETGVKNLGAYIKPEYRDITYFCGIDFHQDIIDWPSLGPNFITMYVYLDTVGVNDAPLHVMPRTHLFGATTFPHNLERTGDRMWLYTSDDGQRGEFQHYLLTGQGGEISLWHPFILHGTQPDTNTEPRLSLRYLIQVQNPGDLGNCGLQSLNERINGQLSLHVTRHDLGNEGDAILKGNHVNTIKY